MSVTTLEEVFIKVAQGTSTNAEAEAGRQKKGKRLYAQFIFPDVTFTSLELKDLLYLNRQFDRIYEPSLISYPFSCSSVCSRESKSRGK